MAHFLEVVYFSISIAELALPSVLLNALLLLLTK